MNDVWPLKSESHLSHWPEVAVSDDLGVAREFAHGITEESPAARAGGGTRTAGTRHGGFGFVAFVMRTPPGGRWPRYVG